MFSGQSGASTAQNKTHKATKGTTGNVLFLDVKQTASARMAMFLFHETNTSKKSDETNETPSCVPRSFSFYFIPAFAYSKGA